MSMFLLRCLRWMVGNRYGFECLKSLVVIVIGVWMAYFAVFLWMHRRESYQTKSKLSPYHIWHVTVVSSRMETCSSHKRVVWWAVSKRTRDCELWTKANGRVNYPRSAQRLPKLIKDLFYCCSAGSSWGGVLQYLSAPTEKTSGWEKEPLLSFIVHSVCSQSGSDSSPLSTATRSAVRGLIAAAAEREEKVSQQGKLWAPLAQNLFFWPFSFLQQFLQCASSVPRTTDP